MLSWFNSCRNAFRFSASLAAALGLMACGGPLEEESGHSTRGSELTSTSLGYIRHVFNLRIVSTNTLDTFTLNSSCYVKPITIAYSSADNALVITDGNGTRYIVFHPIAPTWDNYLSISTTHSDC